MGLNLIDQAHGVFLRFRGKPVSSPAARAEQTEDSIRIRKDGEIVDEVKVEDLKLDQSEQTEDPIMIRYRSGIVDEAKVEDLELDQLVSIRYDTLKQRIHTHWTLYHGLWLGMPLLGTLEKEQTRIRMKRIRMELCSDFYEMQDIYQYNKGMHLSGHCMFYRFCRGNPPLYRLQPASGC
jgi:hypothetical protein